MTTLGILSRIALRPSTGSKVLRVFTRDYQSLARSRPCYPQTPMILAIRAHREINTGSSQAILARLEQSANQNPMSATAQNAFYASLLRANMPQIMIERYQSGQFATSPACEQLYLQALERLGSTTNQLNPEQLSAVGQAVAAQASGGNVSISSGTGAKKEPIYVVVDESRSKVFFRWARFLLGFGLTCWVTLVIMTLAVESMGSFKSRIGTKDAEATPEMQKTRFTDVHGVDEAKEELQELVEFLKNPERFSALGGKLPKGVLLSGPPGTGKTLLARAVAGEAGVPFFYMSGSEFDEMYVGVGAKRVRELFTNARRKAPSIIFIDELDAIGGKRQERDGSHSRQTLNQLLTELDGFEQETGVIVLGATNFPKLLDKALTRPGRFDRNVTIDLPDVRGRIAILRHHMRKIHFDADVSPEVIARGTPGFSGADLENVVNQAAVRASKRHAKKVDLDDLAWAKDKILMGPEKRSMVIQEKDMKMTAFHEGGHALMAMLSKEATPLYKATIMPRGHALGMTMQLPELDQVSQSKQELLDKIDVCMGGKVAEELVYGPDYVTTGASSDITQATNVAYAMITTSGMSDKLGNVDFMSQPERVSPATKQVIDQEVARIISESYDRTKKLLTENRVQLDRLAAALVEHETLDRAEMEAVVRGEKLSKPRLKKITPKSDEGSGIKIGIPTLPLGFPPSSGIGGVDGKGSQR